AVVDDVFSDTAVSNREARCAETLAEGATHALWLAMHQAAVALSIITNPPSRFGSAVVSRLTLELHAQGLLRHPWGTNVVVIAATRSTRAPPPPPSEANPQHRRGRWPSKGKTGGYRAVQLLSGR